MLVGHLKDRVWKLRDVEQKVWTDELADMRQVVDEELRAIRQMAAGLFPASEPTSIDSQNQASDADSDDGGFDVDSMKLKLDGDEDSPLPELYLSQTPAMDGGQSLSW